MKKTQVKRQSVTALLEEVMQMKSEEELRELENYTKEVRDVNTLALGWAEDYTDAVNLEDELSDIVATFITNDKHQVLLGGTPITFKHEGRTYKPMLSGVEIKGKLKRKLTAYLTMHIEPKAITVGLTPALKYIIQYSNYALEVYVFENGNSFYKAYLSSKKDQKKRTMHYSKTYVIEPEAVIDGSMFPEMEFSAVEEALELMEQLTTLSKKSIGAAKAIQDRSDYHLENSIEYLSEIQSLEDRVTELEAELEK